MEAFSYHNIFETKGLEYIAIIAFFLILIPFAIALNKKVKVGDRIKRGLAFLSAKLLNIPQGVYHSGNHTWAFLEKSGNAAVGLDDLLLHITGEVRVVSLKQAGDVVQKGDLIAELSQGEKRLNVYAPVSGRITMQNDRLREEPDLLNREPYGKGWIFKMRPSRWGVETSSLYLAEEASSWASKELDRFRDFLAVSARKNAPIGSHVILQDGGEIYENALSGMPDQTWKDFQKEFMDVR